jgi:hypothetical protein
MKRISIFTIVLMVAALVIASTVSGGIPRTMNYQGRLTDAGGDPVSGTYYMTFEIYDAESDGTQLWAESKIVEVTGGIFTVTLGETNSLDEADLMGNDCWLQFSVEGETIVPRTRLVSSPYSVTAGLERRRLRRPTALQATGDPPAETLPVYTATLRHPTITR